MMIDQSTAGFRLGPSSSQTFAAGRDQRDLWWSLRPLVKSSQKACMIWKKSFNTASTTPPTNSGNFHQKIHTFHCAVQLLYQSSRNTVTLWMIPKIPKDDQLFSLILWKLSGHAMHTWVSTNVERQCFKTTAGRRWLHISASGSALELGGGRMIRRCCLGKILGTLVFSCFFQTCYPPGN